MVRKAAGQQPTPTAAILDSQSVRTAEGGEFRGFDGGQKITGRKRHLVVDTLGLMLGMTMHSADLQGYQAGRFVLDRIRETYGRWKVVFADGAYGTWGFPAWVETACQICKIILQTVLRPVEAKRFVMLPKRWIVERPFGWLHRPRR